MKALHPRFLLRLSTRVRFTLEAQAMERIRHRHVLTVIASGTDDALPWIAMEYAPGGSLDGCIRRSRLVPREAARLVVQACEGVAAAHEVGVVHRDLKPANVLLSATGSCKVADFGLARLAGSGRPTEPGAAMGTEGFLAPEQRQDARRADERSDVYGLGALLYALLLGRRPPPLFASQVDPDLLAGLHAALAPVVARATAFRPVERYPSAAELARAIRAAMGNASLERTRPPAPPGVRSIVPRTP